MERSGKIRKLHRRFSTLLLVPISSGSLEVINAILIRGNESRDQDKANCPHQEAVLFYFSESVLTDSAVTFLRAEGDPQGWKLLTSNRLDVMQNIRNAMNFKLCPGDVNLGGRFFRGFTLKTLKVGEMLCE